MNDIQLAYLVIQELDRARKVYPAWPQDVVLATALMVEEAGECMQAANNLRWGHKNGDVIAVRKEAIETAAMCLRLLLDTEALQV